MARGQKELQEGEKVKPLELQLKEDLEAARQEMEHMAKRLNALKAGRERLEELKREEQQEQLVKEGKKRADLALEFRRARWGR